MATATISKAQAIFENSLTKVSTGNETVDKIARVVVTKLRDQEFEITENETGFDTNFKDCAITISKVAKGKSSRYVLKVGDLEIGGAFASKAYKFAGDFGKETVKAVKTFDAKRVSEAKLLFNID